MCAQCNREVQVPVGSQKATTRLLKPEGRWSMLDSNPGSGVHLLSLFSHHRDVTEWSAEYIIVATCNGPRIENARTK
jgi:hypothetical protein